MSATTPGLDAELALAKSSITQDGELPATVRKRILQLIEELSVVEHAKAGYMRRARLALICAREVLARINPYTAVQGGAESILSNGISALSGKYQLPVLQKENYKFHAQVIDLLKHGESTLASVYAGMASFAAVNAVLFDTNFDELGRSEKEIPPDDWDAGFYASLAVSGSAVWEGKGGATERLSYWHWYLDTAIALAWDVQKPLVVG